MADRSFPQSCQGQALEGRSSTLGFSTMRGNTLLRKMSTRGQPYQIRYLFPAFLMICGLFVNPHAQSQEVTRSSVALFGPGHSNSPDPVCGKIAGDGGFCNTIYVAMPHGSTVRSVEVAAREKGEAVWHQCTLDPSKRFMNCNGLPYFRFLGNTYQTHTHPAPKSDFQVSWKGMNWASGNREGKVTVHFTSPK
jgi:hypothetical protein